MNKYRTHNCSELNEKSIGKNIKLAGWIHRKRDHGNKISIIKNAPLDSKGKTGEITFNQWKTTPKYLEIQKKVFNSLILEAII